MVQIVPVICKCMLAYDDTSTSAEAQAGGVNVRRAIYLRSIHAVTRALITSLLDTLLTFI